MSRQHFIITAAHDHSLLVLFHQAKPKSQAFSSLWCLETCIMWPWSAFIDCLLVKVRQIYYLFFISSRGAFISYKTPWSRILQLNSAFRRFNTAAKITAKTKGFRRFFFLFLERGSFGIYDEKKGLVECVCRSESPPDLDFGDFMFYTAFHWLPEMFFYVGE